MKLSLKNSKILTNDIGCDAEMEKERDVLLIHGSYDYNLEQILKQIVYRIQKKFDLNPELVVRKWLEQDNFQDLFEDINGKIYSQSLNQNGFLKNHLERLLGVNNPDEYANKHLRKEFEKCGYIMDNFSNGYVKFCNCHKYLHKTKYNVEYDDNLKNSKGCEDGEINHLGDVKHYFVKKTGTQILEELIFRLKFNIFLLYSRKVIDVMVKNFVEWINNNYEVHFVAEEGFEKLSKFLKRYQAHFRSKIAFRNKDGSLFGRIYLDRTGNDSGIKEAKIPKRLGFKLLDGIGSELEQDTN